MQQVTSHAKSEPVATHGPERSRGGLEVTQQPRSPWTGAYTDEAFVPLGVVDEQTDTAEQTDGDGHQAGPVDTVAPAESDHGTRAPDLGPLPPERRPVPHEQAPPPVPPERAVPPDRAMPPDRAVPARGAGGTAADFTAERYLRGQGVPPRDSWRRVVYWLTGGRVNPGPSPA